MNRRNNNRGRGNNTRGRRGYGGGYRGRGRGYRNYNDRRKDIKCLWFGLYDGRCQHNKCHYKHEFMEMSEIREKLSVLINRYPDKKHEYFKMRAESYKKERNYEVAIVELSYAIECCPSSKNKYLGDLYYERSELFQLVDGQHNESSINDCNEAISHNPKKYSYYSMKGYLLRRENKQEEALKCFNEAKQVIGEQNFSKKDLENLEFYLGIIKFYQFRNYEECLIHFKKSSPRKNSHHLGKCHYLLGEYDEAILDFTKAIEISNISVGRKKKDRKYRYNKYDYYYRGKCYKALGKDELANNDFNFCIQNIRKFLKDPKNDNQLKTHLYLQLSRTYEETGDLEKSLECNKLAMIYSPEDPQVYRNRTFIKTGFGDPEGALEDQSIVELLEGSDRFSKNENFITKINKERLKKKKNQQQQQQKNKFSLSFQKDSKNDDFLLSQEINSLKKNLEGITIQNLNIIRRIEAGAFGTTYFTLYNDKIPLVVKFFHDKRISPEKKMEYLEKDSLEIEYHRNVVSVLSKSEKIEILDLTKFPDYKEYWDEKRGLDSIESGIIVMKYYRKDLEVYCLQRIEESLKFKDLEICYILNGILSGLYHLYKHKIVHRDLHVKNIFVKENEGRVYIGDFGCALDLRENNNNNNEFLVKTSEKIIQSMKYSSCELKVGGKINILAPEIQGFLGFDIKNSEVRELDYSKNDIFSVGMIGYYIISIVNLEKKICAPFGYYVNSFGRKCPISEKRKQKEYVELDVHPKIAKFVKSMLVLDMDKRIGCKEALEEIEKLCQYFENNNNKERVIEEEEEEEEEEMN